MQNQRNIYKDENSAFLRRKIKEMARRAEHMGYWPQQLNFAVWCATTGCRIFREVLDKVPEQMKSLQMFRIYFIVRWIIFEMGGFQAIRLLAR